jgi:outer membrane receptor protein involved in Fe transport
MFRYGTPAVAIGLAVALLGARPALATAPVALPSTAATQGVVSYAPDFFTSTRPTTAFDMILRLPGFSFDSGAQVRGFADAAGNVLIDGERSASKQDDLGSALSRIPARQVARIDVISGGAPGIDMQGRTVLANVILKHDGGGSAVVAVADKISVQDGQNIPAVDLEWTKPIGARTLEAAFSEGGFVDDGSGPGPHREFDQTGAEVYDAHLWTKAGGYQSTLTGAFTTPFAGGKLRINGLAQLTNYIDHEADDATLPAAGGNDAYKDENAFLQGELGAHYTRDFGGKATLEVLAIQQASRYHENSYFDAVGDNQTFGITNNDRESILRSTLRYNLTPTITLRGALEGAYNTQATGTVYVVNGVGQPLPAANEQVAETRGDAALGATWTPSPRYTLEAGVRFEDSSVQATGDVREGKSLFYPKPRVVFTWSPDPKDQMRLRAEREVGQLDFGAFSASGSLNAGGLHAGNPNALPQQSWTFEAAFERKFWNGGDATVTLRHMDITDAVDRIAVFDPIAGQFFDEGGNLPHGTENDVVVDLTVPLDRLGLKGAQFKTTETWRSTNVIDPITLTSRSQTQVHPLDAEAHFTQDLPMIKSDFGIDWQGGWTETYYRFAEIDSIHYGTRFNAYFEYKPTPAWRIRIQGINLFSQGIQKTYAYSAGPRNTFPVASLVDYRSQQTGPLINVGVRRIF